MHTHLLRLLPTAGLLLAALLPLRAENMQPLEIRLDPARAAHAFALGIGGGEAFAVENFGLHESNAPFLEFTFTTLFSVSADLDQPITLSISPRATPRR